MLGGVEGRLRRIKGWAQSLLYRVWRQCSGSMAVAALREAAAPRQVCPQDCHRAGVNRRPTKSVAVSSLGLH